MPLYVSDTWDDPPSTASPRGRMRAVRAAARGDSILRGSDTMRGWVLVGCAALALGQARAEDAVKISFTLEAPRARTVSVAGEFNGWAPDAWPMTRGEGGVFRREARLAPGVYRYKFVVDGEWTHDPKNPRRDPDAFGNSVLVVG